MTEFRPGSFQILPTVIKNLLIINVLVFLGQKIFGDQLHYPLDDWFALHAWQSEFFQPWQLITHLFMHGDVWHIFGNMLALWMFGSVLENLWGPKRFIIFYLICGLGAAFCHLTVLYFENQSLINEFNSLSLSQQNTYQNTLADKINEPTIGASGAVFGCLAAFGYLFPNDYVYLNFFIPVKAKWLVLGYAGYELFQAIQNSAGDNVAHIAHLGGALFGIILVWFWGRNNRRNIY